MAWNSLVVEHARFFPNIQILFDQVQRKNYLGGGKEFSLMRDIY